WRAFFSLRGSGLPVVVTLPSSWTWVAHSVSGLRPHTSFALFRLAFAAAPCLPLNLAYDRNSPVHSTKGTPLRINALRLLVGTRFQVLFHSPSGVLFTFPSRYWFTIGHWGVFSLGRWSSRIPTEFHVFRRTQDPLRRKCFFNYRAVTLFGWPFQTDSFKAFLDNSIGVSYHPGE